MVGIRVDVIAARQSIGQMNATAMYAKSASVSHFKYFAYVLYGRKISKHKPINEKTISNETVGTGTTRRAASAIMSKLAAIFTTFAMNNRRTTGTTSDLEYSRMLRPRPFPVTSTIRAHISCTANMSGKVKSRVQSGV